MIEERSPVIEIAAMRSFSFTERSAHMFYCEHVGKEYFGRLTEHMISGPCVGIVLRSGLDDMDVVKIWRTIMGPAVGERPAWTVRARLCLPDDPPHVNLVHGSDSEAAFERESRLAFFQPSDYL